MKIYICCGLTKQSLSGCSLSTVGEASAKKAWILAVKTTLF